MSTLLTNSIGSPLEALYYEAKTITLSDYFPDAQLLTDYSNGAKVPFFPCKNLCINIGSTVVTASFLYGMLRNWLWCVAIQHNIKDVNIMTEYVSDHIVIVSEVYDNGIGASAVPELLRAVRRFWDTDSHNLTSIYTVRNLA